MGQGLPTIRFGLVPRRTAAIVSFRLGGTDGVAIEAAKWEWALGELGFGVVTVAGEGRVDRLVAGLAMDAAKDRADSARHSADLTAEIACEFAESVADADLVVVENVCSLPLNPPALEAVASVLEGRPAVMHHHDLPWQRPATARFGPPPDDPAWVHVTLNDVSRRELADRGIEAKVVRNCFDTEAPLGDRAQARAACGVREGEIVVLQPTRAIPRKNVPGAIAVAEELGATYWLLGPAEDGYGSELERLLAHASVRVMSGFPATGAPFRIADAYAACDVVAMPSFWEGFGNPTIESAIHRRPLSIGPYPVAAELEAFGFEWFGLDQTSALAAWLAEPDPALLEHNLDVARHNFALSGLPEKVGLVLKEANWF